MRTNSIPINNAKTDSSDAALVVMTFDEVERVADEENALWLENDSFLSFASPPVDVFHLVHGQVQPIDVLLAYDSFVE